MKLPLMALGLALTALPLAAASIFDTVSESEQETAVSSKAYNGYVRSRNPDGTYKPESVAFGEGGIIGFYLGNDASFDHMGFRDIAQVVATQLRRQAYIQTQSPEETKLLVMVYWGTTTGGRFIQNGFQRDLDDYNNAKILGFDSEPPFRDMKNPEEDAAAFFWGPTVQQNLTRSMHEATMSAIEANRYFVVLRAYDFPMAWKQKKLKLLWETRFSLPQRLHEFDKELPVMAQAASMYFGHDSFGLVYTAVPEGRVEIGEARVLDDSPASVGDLTAVAGTWVGSSKGYPMIYIHFDPAGNSTFDNPTLGRSAPARVSVEGSDVTVKVPGWGVIFQGKLKGDTLSGSLSRYGESSTFTLRRSTKAPPADPASYRESPAK
jgi:hypothetical protein